MSETNNIISKDKRVWPSLFFSLHYFDRSCEIQKNVEMMVKIKLTVEKLIDDMKKVKGIDTYSLNLLERAVNRIVTVNQYKFDEKVRERLS